MYRVHTSSLSSTTTTTEPVSSLPPHVLFPFFQPPPPTQPPTTTTTSPTGTTTTTTSSSSSTAPPSSAQSAAAAVPPAMPALPYPVTPNFISLPSSNSYQSILLPLPAPAALFDPLYQSPPPPSCPPSAPSPPPPSPSPPPPPSAADASSAVHPQSAAPVATGCVPLLVFSHGSTSVDTYIPSTRMLQRTLYSWSQLSDYSTMHCWHLPPTATSSSSSTSPSSMSFTNGSGRLCSEAEVHKCPGHPWVNYSYHMQVKQWQEHRDTADPHPHAAQQQPHTQPQPPQPCPAPSVGVEGVERREGGWLGAMSGKVPEVRVLSPNEVFSGRRRGMSAEDADALHESNGGSASDMEAEEQPDWDDLCTTEGEEEEDLTDIDM